MLRALLMFVATAGGACAHGLLHDQLAGLNRSIERTPANAALYLKRGELHRLHRDWRAAEADFDAVRQLDPDAIDVELARSRLATDRGLLPDADAALGRYLAARPDSEVALAARADLRARMGAHSAAAADYARAIRVSSDPRVEYYLGQAQAQALANADDDSAALEVIAAGLARFGPLAVLEQWRVDVLVRARRWDDALAHLDVMLDRAPRKETGLTRRAEILLLAERPDEARAAFDAARTAWEALSEQQRATQAMIELRHRIDTAIAAAPEVAARR